MCARSTTRLFAVLAETGPAGVAVRVVQRVVPRRVLHVEWFLIVETLPGVDPAPLGGSLPTLRWAGPADVAAVGALARGARVVSERLARGDRCAIVDEAGRVSACVFVRSGAYDETGVRFPLAADERWFYDAWVAPAERGRRLHSLLTQAVVDALARDGVRRVLSTVDHLNRASVRSLRHRRSRAVGDALVLQTAGITVSAVRMGDGRRSWRVHRGPRSTRVPAVVARSRGDLHLA